jgi:hypothetical protein
MPVAAGHSCLTDFQINQISLMRLGKYSRLIMLLLLSCQMPNIEAVSPLKHDTKSPHYSYTKGSIRSFFSLPKRSFGGPKISERVVNRTFGPGFESPSYASGLQILAEVGITGPQWRWAGRQAGLVYPISLTMMLTI